mmetsp:Transcript_7357/g.6515  ORF Transcript_7357/g.6515 Transcript_7357/m.6515 type:complete len:90 (+) Transcript_7357:186-455(+)
MDTNNLGQIEVEENNRFSLPPLQPNRNQPMDEINREINEEDCLFTKTMPKNTPNLTDSRKIKIQKRKLKKARKKGVIELDLSSEGTSKL